MSRTELERFIAAARAEPALLDRYRDVATVGELAGRLRADGYDVSEAGLAAAGRPEARPGDGVVTITIGAGLRLALPRPAPPPPPPPLPPMGRDGLDLLFARLQQRIDAANRTAAPPDHAPPKEQP